jgi:hypothetical protein
VSGRMTATLPLPAAVSGFSTDIADRVRSNWATEIDTLTPDEPVGLLVPPAAAEDEELLLQAAAARHKASDADATTAPFLAILIIKTTSRLKEGRRVTSRHARLTP